MPKGHIMSEAQEEMLQSDNTETSGITFEADESIASTEESATPEPEVKEPELTPEQVETQKEEKRQAAFNTQYGKTKQAERERDALQAQLDEAAKANTQPPPEAGTFPNEFDYDTTEAFEAAKSGYINSLQLNANYNAQLEAQNAQAQFAQQAEINKQNASDAETAQNVLTKAKSYGIEEAEIQQNAQSLINYGMSTDVFRAIAQDEESPLLMKHLAANSQEVQSLSQMNPVQAGAYIATVLKPKAVALKPKASNAPTPVTAVQGGGIDPEKGKHPFADRATYS